MAVAPVVVNPDIASNRASGRPLKVPASRKGIAPAKAQRSQPPEVIRKDSLSLMSPWTGIRVSSMPGTPTIQIDVRKANASPDLYHSDQARGKTIVDAMKHKSNPIARATALTFISVNSHPPVLLLILTMIARTCLDVVAIAAGASTVRTYRSVCKSINKCPKITVPEICGHLE